MNGFVLTEKGGEVGLTYRITRMDKVHGGEAEVLIAYTDDQAEVGCIIDEDRHKIDWEAQYLVQREGRILHKRLVKYRTS